jgi:hypothetical protein
VRKEIEGQIRKITQSFAASNISIASNFPKWDGNDLVWEKFKNLSFSLKNENYQTIYIKCFEQGDYNLVLMDGALIQMKYRFNKEEVIEHVLSFYPSPFMERFQDNPSDFMATYFSGDELFSEITGESPVCSPIRFDFNCSEKIFREMEHPKSHLTIGDYKNCRIPIKSPLSPNRFIKFILRSFYYEKFSANYTDNFFKCDLRFAETIFGQEKHHLYFNWSNV